MSVRIKVGDPCICWNEDQDKFKWYRDSNDKICGQFCLDCHMEWLPKQYQNRAGIQDLPDGFLEEAQKDTGAFLSLTPRDTDSFFLFLSEPTELKENTAFLIQPSRTKVDPNIFAKMLKRGDHVTWHRAYGLWHHAIVSDIRPETAEIIVIEWTTGKDLLDIKIKESPLKIRGDNLLFNQMYRLDYPKEVTDRYDSELVLARARSRIGDTGYKPFIDNCEHFATFCKTGSAKSHQLAWMKAKLIECVGVNVATVARSLFKGGCRATTKVAKAVPKSATEVIPAELIEEISNGSDAIGAGIVIVLETYYVICDLSEHYAKRQSGEISRNDFLEEMLRRVVEGLVTVGFTVSGTIGTEFAVGSFAAASTIGPVGVLLGAIAGGIISGAIGRAFGTWLGSLTGIAVAVPFQDDRAVNNINDLKRGDHIILGGWCLHPRCHAILIKHDGEDEITVIRNTYEDGVREERLKFDQVLYKVHYDGETSLDADVVICNAWAKLGHYKYNLVLYNCKTFAVECKTCTPVADIKHDFEGIALGGDKFDL